MSLLEKALAVKTRRKPRKVAADKVELAVAFFRGEVTYPQVATVMGKAHRNICGTLGAVLRNAILAGRVKLDRVKP